MRCEICSLGPVEGVNVYRVNEKGVTGIWRCDQHLGTAAPVDPEVKAIVNAIQPDATPEGE